jgi:arsenate reductase (thioredoxin)
MNERLPRVLFVCVQNAGRSQMAQALYERRGGACRSAGSTPAERVHPEVAAAMREVGLEVGERRPKGLAREDVEWAELVVTMGGGDACPVLPGKRYLDWELPDPAGAPLDEVRSVRDEIDRRVAELGT